MKQIVSVCVSLSPDFLKAYAAIVTVLLLVALDF